MFALNGLMVTIFFLLCYHIRYVSVTTIYYIKCCDCAYSDSILGAIFGTLQFFYNHSEVCSFLYSIPLFLYFCQGYKSAVDTSLKRKLCFSMFNFTTIYVKYCITVS